MHKNNLKIDDFQKAHKGKTFLGKEKIENG
jgi:hypothetical protein